jgi:predicted transcriptional regulator
MSTPEGTGARKPTKSSAKPAAKTTSLKLPAELRERVTRLADNRKRSAHWVMVEAIERYVSDAEARDAMWRDANEAIKHYDETGLHLTFKEVDEWMTKVIAGEDAELPECHT